MRRFFVRRSPLLAALAAPLAAQTPTPTPANAVDPSDQSAVAPALPLRAGQPNSEVILGAPCRARDSGRGAAFRLGRTARRLRERGGDADGLLAAELPVAGGRQRAREGGRGFREAGRPSRTERPRRS